MNSFSASPHVKYDFMTKRKSYMSDVINMLRKTSKLSFLSLITKLTFVFYKKDILYLLM